MKIRNGFVSNSSSSSFIIHRSYINEKQIKELNNLYDDLVAKEELYDDAGEIFSIENNYISFNACGGQKILLNKLQSFGINENKIYRIEG